eukprot:2037412-Ditylum_brightwellii.AAC.1
MEHQPPTPTLLNDIPDNLWVRHSIGLALFVHLDDIDGVGACVRDNRGAEAKDVPLAQLPKLHVLLWYFSKRKL